VYFDSSHLYLLRFDACLLVLQVVDCLGKLSLDFGGSYLIPNSVYIANIRIQFLGLWCRLYIRPLSRSSISSLVNATSFRFVVLFANVCT
jgi:hypothetical protein